MPNSRSSKEKSEGFIAKAKKFLSGDGDKPKASAKHVPLGDGAVGRAAGVLKNRKSRLDAQIERDGG